VIITGEHVVKVMEESEHVVSKKQKIPLMKHKKYKWKKTISCKNV